MQKHEGPPPDPGHQGQQWGQTRLLLIIIAILLAVLLLVLRTRY
jgi:hypothetical protein